MAIGFNPLPNISLGDMERIFDIENELEIINDTEASSTPTVGKIKPTDVMRKFQIAEVVGTEDSEGTKHQEVCLTAAPVAEKSEEQQLREILEQQELEEKQRRAREEQRLAELRRAEEQRLAEEQRQAEQRKAEAERQAEQRKAEAERLERLRQLEEEAAIAEKEAELAKRKREAEQRRLAEEERIQELKRQASEAEQLKKEKLKQVLLEKKRREEAERLKKQSSLAGASDRVQRQESISIDSKEADKYDKYTALDIDALYEEVRKFLRMHNVERKVIDAKRLEDEFGKANIKKLIVKSYLISIGKGVTVGR